MTSAALYARVSTEEQAMEGYSIGAQKEILENYCIAQGYEVYNVYVDDGYSGRNTRRPGYRRMMEEMPEWDVLVVLKMDRIHRNTRNFMNMMEALTKQNKQFVSATESLDTTNAMGRFVVSMIQNIAQLESEQIGERTYVGMREKAENMERAAMASGESRTMGFNPPFGYRLNGGVLVAVPEELEIVGGMYSDYLSGKTINEIAETLNRSGVRTRRGNRWNVHNLRTILHNPIYAGYMRWDGVTFRHFAKAPVDPVTFNGVQRLAASKVRDPSKRAASSVPEDDFELRAVRHLNERPDGLGMSEAKKKKLMALFMVLMMVMVAFVVAAAYIASL